MRSGERERERWVSFQIDGCGIVSARAKPRLKRSLVQLQPVSKYPTLNLFPPLFFPPKFKNRNKVTLDSYLPL